MKKLVAFVAIAGMIFGVSAAHAATDSVTKTVTVKVPGHLSITENTGNFELNFSSFAASGDDTDTKTVTYRLKGNNMTTAALDGVVSAKIDALETGIDLKADVGTYSNQGSSGNSTLTEQNSGFVTIGTSVVNLAKKGATSGNQAKILHGDLPITYKATATADLATGDYPMDLTVTLKDS